ncbi:hypothetical protein BD779DRAFT_1486297 [Infundibulicybe gibba]|nr:hypothetical protein BD779DRAFT_1486297 [Infundibulicybe gibba]
MLPSVLPSNIGIQDTSTTPEDLKAALTRGKVTSPQETAIFICTLQDCNRLFRSRERIIVHQKRDHASGEDVSQILTWNE